MIKISGYFITKLDHSEAVITYTKIKQILNKNYNNILIYGVLIVLKYFKGRGVLPYTYKDLFENNVYNIYILILNLPK